MNAVNLLEDVHINCSFAYKDFGEQVLLLTLVFQSKSSSASSDCWYHGFVHGAPQET